MDRIQELWAIYLLENGSNNMMLNKVRRSAFYAGARAIRDDINASQEEKFKYVPGLRLVDDDD